MRYVLLLWMVAALPAAQGANWPGLEYLMGEWTGTGSGMPGQGSGSFSFKEDLQGKVLVRKNRAEYPPAKDRPAFVHDDLMVVYHETPGGPARAMYFDSEGHVIRYEVRPAQDGSQIVFESAPETGAPRYRLTYTRVDAGQLKIKFEIAPPGEASAYKTYIEAGAHRGAGK